MISFIMFTIYSIKIYSENLERNPSDKNKELTGLPIKKESDVKFLNKKQIERKTISR